MKITLCICVSLALMSPQIALAGKQKGKEGKGGGGGAAKAAHAGGGAGGAGKGARFGGGGGAGARMGGGAQHNVRGNNVRNAGQSGHGQHGLNAHQGGGRGLNAHQGARHGLNARAGSGLQGHRAGKLSGNRALNARFAGRGRFAGHWRSGLRWRNSHALYAGYHRAWHDRWWWRGHYNHIAFVGGAYWGGCWYWDGGYWFPAWGYDPLFVAYVYDGPIFAYANLPPDQIVVNVQEELQDQGYYQGDIDGQLGSQTRDALAAYQRDHDLEVSAAIDEPTVVSLGLANQEAA
jgi:hypothetical protein